MIKALKLQKAVYLIVAGVVLLIASRVLDRLAMGGGGFVLGMSGACFMLGALLFLYPVFFAKKADKDGQEVELEPMSKPPSGEE